MTRPPEVLVRKSCACTYDITDMTCTYLMLKGDHMCSKIFICALFVKKGHEQP